MLWKFQRDVSVEGVAYSAGQVVEDKDLSDGCIESMRRVKWICECPDDTSRKPPKRKKIPSKVEAVPESDIESNA